MVSLLLNTRNAFSARDAAVHHGSYLGQELRSKFPNLETLHLIAHSAGTWVARGAIKDLLINLPSIDVQFTALDAYVPIGDSFLSKNAKDLSFDLTFDTKPLLEEVAGWFNVSRSEQYYIKNFNLKSVQNSEDAEKNIEILQDITGAVTEVVLSGWSLNLALNGDVNVPDVVDSEFGAFSSHRYPVIWYGKTSARGQEIFESEGTIEQLRNEYLVNGNAVGFAASPLWNEPYKPPVITASAGTGGNISPSGSVTVNHGDSQSFIITPSSGYEIANVTVDGSSVGAVSSYPFTNVTSDHTIHATFFANGQYTISASAGTNGSISPSGSVTVNHGDSQSFTVTPNSGYEIADVIVDGSSVGAVSSYPFTNVKSGHMIHATFVIVGEGENVPLVDPIQESIPMGSIAIELQTVVDGLVSPLGVRFPDDGTGRMFVYDQVGVVHVVENDVVTGTLLDVTELREGIVVGNETIFSERGLIGFALHPDFAANGLVYTHTSEVVDGVADFPVVVGATVDHQSVIAEWQVDGVVAPVDTRREILRID